MKRSFAVLLMILIALSSSPLPVLAGGISPLAAKFLEGDILTAEIEQLAEQNPELKQTHSEERKTKIQEARSDDSKKWTERIVLGKLERGDEVGDVLGKRKDAEKVVADLKKAGVITTMADATSGEEKEINPTLKTNSKNKTILETTETPYGTEISTDSTEPLILSENSDAAGNVVSAETSDNQVADDSTPDIQEEIRYFNWNANDVEGTQEENKILYRDLWSSTDLLVTMGEMGVKEDIILKNAAAPTDFNYIVETVGLELQTTDDGGYIFLDENGEEKFYTPAPNITDADGNFVESGIRYELGWRENMEDERQNMEQEKVEAEVKKVDPVLAEIKFDENSGEETTDTKSENSGTLGGAKWFADGIRKSALLFDGESSVEIPRDFELNKTMTISAWVKSSKYQNAQIVGIGRNSLQQDSNKGWKASFRVDDKNLNVAWKTSALYLEKWYHLVATFDGEKIRIFTDGEEENYLEAAGSLTPNTEPILVGGGAGNFAGVIDEVQIYNHALSAEEIRELHEKYLEPEEDLESGNLTVEGELASGDGETSMESQEVETLDDAEVAEEVEIEVIEESELSEEELAVIREEEAGLVGNFEDAELTAEEITPTEEAPAEETSTEAETLENEEVLDSRLHGNDNEKEIIPTETPVEETIVPTEVQVDSVIPEPAGAGESSEGGEAPTEEIPAVEPAAPEETPAEEIIPTETPAEEIIPTEEISVPVEEIPVTSFFDLLKAFFLPVANAAETSVAEGEVSQVEEFDEAVSIEEIVESNTVFEVERVVEEVVEAPPPEVEMLENAVEEILAEENAELTTENLNNAELTTQNEEITPTEEVTVDEALETGTDGEEVLDSRLHGNDNEEEIAPTETETVEGEEISTEAETLEDEEVLDSSAAADENDNIEEIEIEVIEESELTMETDGEIEVIEESEVEKFFAPEKILKTEIEIAEDVEIEVLSEQEVFAQSSAIVQEIEESDGTILRRYKLRLVIDVDETWNMKHGTEEIISEEVPTKEVTVDEALETGTDGEEVLDSRLHGNDNEEEIIPTEMDLEGGGLTVESGLDSGDIEGEETPVEENLKEEIEVVEGEEMSEPPNNTESTDTTEVSSETTVTEETPADETSNTEVVDELEVVEEIIPTEEITPTEEVTVDEALETRTDGEGVLDSHLRGNDNKEEIISTETEMVEGEEIPAEEIIPTETEMVEGEETPAEEITPTEEVTPTETPTDSTSVQPENLGASVLDVEQNIADSIQNTDEDLENSEVAVDLDETPLAQPSSAAGFAGGISKSRCRRL